MVSDRDTVKRATDRELIEKWRTLVFEPSAEAVADLLAAFPDRRALSVPFEACGTDYRFTAPLLAEPDRTFDAGRRALEAFASERFDGELEADARLYLRVTGVPDSVRYPLESIRTEHLHRLVVVGGTVDRVGRPRPRIVTACFECEHCGSDTMVSQRGSRLRRSVRCSHCNTTGTLTLATNCCTYVDAQRLVLCDGERQLPAVLEHDLAGQFSVGDRLDLVAIPRARVDDGNTTADIELEAISATRRAADVPDAEPVRSVEGGDSRRDERDGSRRNERGVVARNVESGRVDLQGERATVESAVRRPLREPRR